MRACARAAVSAALCTALAGEVASLGSSSTDTRREMTSCRDDGAGDERAVAEGRRVRDVARRPPGGGRGRTRAAAASLAATYSR